MRAGTNNSSLEQQQHQGYSSLLNRSTGRDRVAAGKKRRKPLAHSFKIVRGVVFGAVPPRQLDLWREHGIVGQVAERWNSELSRIDAEINKSSAQRKYNYNRQNLCILIFTSQYFFRRSKLTLTHYSDSMGLHLSNFCFCVLVKLAMVEWVEHIYTNIFFMKSCHF